MLTDQELIDGLRRELDDLDPPVELLERVRRASSPPPPRRPRRWPRLPMGTLAVATSTAFVLAVAIGALVLIRRPTAKHRTATVTHQPSLDRSLARLAASQFDVFRRPQTAKDRSLAAALRSASRLGGLGPGFDSVLNGVVPSLTRYTQTLPDGREVFLTVGSPGPRLPRRDLQELLNDKVLVIGEFIVRPDGKWNDGQPVLNPAGGESAGDAYLIDRSGRQGCALDTYWIVAPDQVARIRWQFGRQDPLGYVYKAPLTVDLTVHGNVAVTTIPQRAGCDSPTTVTLYGHDGQVLSHTGNAADLERITRPVRHGNPFAYRARMRRFRGRPGSP